MIAVSLRGSSSVLLEELCSSSRIAIVRYYNF